jgi:hypothetical protein
LKFCAKDEFSPLETLTFVFPLFFFNACIIISREEERMRFSLFPLSVFSLRGEDFFERDGDDDRVRRLRPRRSNDR